MERGFDPVFEMEHAAKIAPDQCKYDIVWTLKPMGYDAGNFGYLHPAVWNFEDRFAPGYQTEDEYHLFVDWLLDDRGKAIVAADRFTGLCAEVILGKR
ncbi:hypothetical protein [Asticcacaulis tiandongensis]|uniref:hypothetical protein n=1 Tax=Asticcacaulis tiandongensis TaxID=2565365 RepID=UPI00112B6765|nr:hypothetical protein [Asticcacaulis tiandongensis]